MPKMMDDKLRCWLIKHYKHTENSVIMAKFGLSNYFLHKYARELGLGKSRAFMLKVLRTNSAKGLAVLAEKGWPPKGYIIPNQDKALRNSIAKTKGKKQKKEQIERRKATIKALRESERRRVLFGLEQRTKFRVTHAPKYKIQIRSKMRGLGYSIERGANIAYITVNTQRSSYYEDKAKQYGIEIKKN